MPKKRYTINGVEVDYETYHNVMDGDPNDFANLNNIDAPDIPQIYKDMYAHDKWNDFMGRGRTWFTPRKRMLNNIEHNEKLLAEKKEKRLKERQRKMDAWGEQRKSDEEWKAHLDLMHKSESDRVAYQEDQDSKSALLMTAVIGGGFLFMCIMFVAEIYISHGGG